MPVQFFFENSKISLPQRIRLKRFIASIFQEEGHVFSSVNYIFCSDEYLRVINRRFLSHNYFTDIITFNLGEKKDVVEGEIYISLDRVRENATILKIPVRRELYRVIFHGVLHLCGYKDKSSRNKNEMRRREDYYLDLYFLNVPRETANKNVPRETSTSN